jgi:hypothetical protein
MKVAALAEIAVLTLLFGGVRSSDVLGARALFTPTR